MGDEIGDELLELEAPIVDIDEIDELLPLETPIERFDHRNPDHLELLNEDRYAQAKKIYDDWVDDGQNLAEYVVVDKEGDDDFALAQSRQDQMEAAVFAVMQLCDQRSKTSQHAIDAI